MDLSNQSAIVTGGASGLGHATARRLADAGAAVVVVDLPDREGETVRADAVAALGPRTRFVTGDVTAEDTAREAVAAALEAGPLRVLVNCAGVATPGMTYLAQSPEVRARMRELFFETARTMSAEGTLTFDARAVLATGRIS